MDNKDKLYDEKMACLFLLQQALEQNDKEKAFILAMRIEEINAQLENNDFNYKENRIYKNVFYFFGFYDRMGLE